MAETNSAFRTETRDEPLYNHLELFNTPSSSIEAPAANDYRDCRGQQQTGNIGKGRRMFSDYRTESNNEHLYNNIQSINKPSSPATESQAANQTSQDDRGGQQPTVNRKTIGLRVLTAMIAVLALAFLAMLASLIALKWELVKSRETNGQVIVTVHSDQSSGASPDQPIPTSPYQPSLASPRITPSPTMPHQPSPTSPSQPGLPSPDQPGLPSPDQPGLPSPDQPGPNRSVQPHPRSQINPRQQVPIKPSLTSPDQPSLASPGRV